ncbi:unnamed protein product [Darwinula stevensoni]|uniref:Uncharacterized protein n=1 Tax=Darwinula stevensoni TaxID=69355 RepID=A0A7R9AAU5_9CRUS|nr:unnamed protein product [Darwinula stevensoni]CAG0898350.1 unnamed protein product [Darwinula stevensoni]
MKETALDSVSELKCLAELEEMMWTMMAKFEELAKDTTQLKLDNEQLKITAAQLELNVDNLKSLLENTMEDRLQYLEAITRQISELLEHIGDQTSFVSHRCKFVSVY